MRFNTNEIQLFIEYYKYFIILRNVLSNYHKTDIKNIKLESIKEDTTKDYEEDGYDYYIPDEKYLNIRYLINNRLFISLTLQIKPTISAFGISCFLKNHYEFNYKLIKNKNKNSIKYKYNKYYYNIKILYYKNKNIILKSILLKPLVSNNMFLDTIEIYYYYGLHKYKIYAIYTKKFNNIYGNIYGNSAHYVLFNEYSYISKLLI